MTEPVSLASYGRHGVTDEDVAAVTKVLRGDWLTQGPTVAAFEAAFSERTGAGHAISCANGTAALHLAYLALGLGPGDAVVVPAITFLATASAAHLVGADVVFADVDPDSGLLTMAGAEAAVEAARACGLIVRAIAPVDFAGQTPDLGALSALASELPDGPAAIVEDASHAVGGMVSISKRESMVGACAVSTLTTFSFHPVKTIAAGEGGMVTTNDPELAARVRRFANHGIVRRPEEFRYPDTGCDHEGTAGAWYHEMPEPGFNYRLSDIHAALALSQLERLSSLVERRARLMELYRDRLAPLAPWIRPLTPVPWCRPAWHLCVVLIDFAGLKRGRAGVMAGLKARGIGTQVLYIPVNRQPFWRERGAPALPGAGSYYERSLALPLFPAMADSDVDRVVEALAAETGLA